MGRVSTGQKSHNNSPAAQNNKSVTYFLWWPQSHCWYFPIENPCFDESQFIIAHAPVEMIQYGDQNNLSMDPGVSKIHYHAHHDGFSRFFWTAVCQLWHWHRGESRCPWRGETVGVATGGKYSHYIWNPHPLRLDSDWHPAWDAGWDVKASLLLVNSYLTLKQTKCLTLLRIKFLPKCPAALGIQSVI